MAAIVTLFVWWPFLTGQRVDNHALDWSFRSNYTSYAVTSFRDYGEIPYWVTENDYKQVRLRHRFSFFANPETEVFAPLTWLYLLLPFSLAVRVDLVLHLLLGVFGVAIAGRRLVGKPHLLPSLLVTLLVLCNGAVIAHTVAGHLQFRSFCFFPLVFGLLLGGVAAKSHRSRLLYCATGGALLAIAFYEGNAHLLLHFLFFLCLYFTVHALLRPQERRGAIHAVAITLLTFVGLAAYKLLPAAVALRGYRASYFSAFPDVGSLVHSLFVPTESALRRGGMDLGHHEATSYLGVLGVLAVLVGIARFARPTAQLLLCASVLLTLSLRDPAAIAAKLSLFSSQGAFGRMRLVGLLCLGLCSFYGWQALVNGARRRGRRTYTIVIVFVALLVGAFAVDLRLNAMDAYLDRFAGAPWPELHRARVVAPRLRSTVGSCRLKVAAHGVNWFRFEYSGAGCLSRFCQFRLVAQRPATRVPLRVSGEAVGASEAEQFAVIPTGQSGRFELRYASRSLAVGKWTSLITGILLLVIWGGRLRRYRSAVRGCEASTEVNSAKEGIGPRALRAIAGSPGRRRAARSPESAP
ncbi:MAG: hypothetical protein H6707_04100 [Deltaproteobacteria bacterium]|nr:hypothetical protein [Deltaproteobacteria bacterium]